MPEKSSNENAGTEKEKSDEEWKEDLSPEDYHILRKKGTERPYTGKYFDYWATGIYRCKACGEVLFSSEDKFDAGCGWPSFSDAEDNNIELKLDLSHGMRRTEVLCRNCGGHMGHLFDDGPRPSGKRYCINSASISFEDTSGEE